MSELSRIVAENNNEMMEEWKQFLRKAFIQRDWNKVEQFIAMWEEFKFTESYEDTYRRFIDGLQSIK